MSNYKKYIEYNRKYSREWAQRKKQNKEWYEKWKEYQKNYWHTIGKLKKPIRYRESYVKTRFMVLTRDNYTCQYCGRKAPEVILNIDHIKPKSKGGDNKIENLITACRDCNFGKSDILLEEHKLK